MAALNAKIADDKGRAATLAGEKNRGDEDKIREIYRWSYARDAKPEEIQFRFRRAPWLIRGQSVEQVIRENIRTTTIALKERCGIEARTRSPAFRVAMAARNSAASLTSTVRVGVNAGNVRV